MAPKAELAKLVRSKRPTLMTFVAWRRGVERWAKMAGGADMTMDRLRPAEVAEAAWHFLDATLLEELRLEDRLEVTWERLLGHLREALGLTLRDLKAALYDEGQADAETTSAYAARFEATRREVRMSEESAKDVLVRGLSDGGHRFLTRRLEIAHGLCENVPLDDTLEGISYQEILRVLRARDYGGRPTRRQVPAIHLTQVDALEAIEEEPVRGGKEVQGSRDRRQRGKGPGVLSLGTVPGVYYAAAGSSVAPAQPSE
jgi:hypothetical protein